MSQFAWLGMWKILSPTSSDWRCTVRHSANRNGRNPRHVHSTEGVCLWQHVQWWSHARTRNQYIPASVQSSRQRVGALSLIPCCLGISGHSIGSRQGHPWYIGARSAGRPWVARIAFQPLRPTEINPCEHLPSISIVRKDARSVTDESTSKMKESATFKFEFVTASVKIQFLERLFSQRSYKRIHSSSIEQRLRGLNCFAIYYGRSKPFRIHFGQAPHRIWNSGFKDCKRNLPDYSDWIQEQDLFLGGDSSIFVLLHQ